MWPFTEIGISSEEAGAVLWTGFFAAMIAFWGVLSHRQFTRKNATMEYLTRYEADEDIIRARTVFSDLTRDEGALLNLVAFTPKPGERIEVSDEVNEQIEAVRTILNSNELIAVGIQLGIIDYKLYYRFSRIAFMRDWNHAKAFVVALRDRYKQDTLYHEFEQVAAWMDEGKRPPIRRRWMLNL